jgi:hypothetical protein
MAALIFTICSAQQSSLQESAGIGLIFIDAEKLKLDAYEKDVIDRLSTLQHAARPSMSIKVSGRLTTNP